MDEKELDALVKHFFEDQDVGVDLDDTSQPTTEALMNFYNRTEKGSLTMQDFYTWDLAQVFGISEKEKNRVVEAFYESPEFLEMGFVPQAVPKLKTFKAQGARLYVITGRASYNTELATIRTLDAAFGSNFFKEVAFTQTRVGDGLHGSKIGVAKRLGIKRMVDDRPDVAQNLVEGGIRVFLREVGWKATYSNELVANFMQWYQLHYSPSNGLR